MSEKFAWAEVKYLFRDVPGNSEALASLRLSLPLASSSGMNVSATLEQVSSRVQNISWASDSSGLLKREPSWILPGPHVG